MNIHSWLDRELNLFLFQSHVFRQWNQAKTSHFKTPTLEYYEVVTDVLFLATERKGKHPNFTNIIYFG